MSDQEYSAEWPGLWGHFVSASRNIANGDSDQTDDEESLADKIVDMAIEEALIRRAERRRNETQRRGQ